VTAFIDWNSQLINSGAVKLEDPIERARIALDRTARAIAKNLIALDAAARFRVALRLYHGWYKGFEAMPNRRALVRIIAEGDINSISPWPAVVFSPNVQFGDQLLMALPARSHARTPVHLPNTLRAQDGKGRLVEKMVDTALATDLLSWARSEPSDWAIVLAEDDDMVPPLFAAEAWTKPFGGRAIMFRHREFSKAFLLTDGIVERMS
jgi:hypothetical protein